MRLSFHGGARDVTGACHLLETDSAKILIDCGMFQGAGESGWDNAQEFGFDAAGIGALVITHAHLDHVGRIPLLVRHGFSGTIYSTPPTRDLSRLILEDALALAEREPRGHLSWTEKDLDQAFALWKTIPYYEPFRVADVAIQFFNAGHILGSVFVQIDAEGKRLLFTGDMGNTPSALLPPHDSLKKIEYLVIESVYGNRTHESPDERVLMLERAVEDVAARRGTLLIPAFATERTQDILFFLNAMLHFKRVPECRYLLTRPWQSA